MMTTEEENKALRKVIARIIDSCEFSVELEEAALNLTLEELKVETNARLIQHYEVAASCIRARQTTFGVVIDRIKNALNSNKIDLTIGS